MGRKRVKKQENAASYSDEDFYSCIQELAYHPVVLRMKRYPHHGTTSCYQHCLNVAYYNYRICRFFGLDAKSAARAGMLHDLFLYDWHGCAKRTGNHIHGLTHPWDALKNARKYFRLNDLEREMIVKHMWPLTVVPPTSWESLIICLTDKYCGACETAGRFKKVLFGLRYPGFMRLLRRIFGRDYRYGDYRISSPEAAKGNGFVPLRRRPQPSGNWKKASRTGRKRR